MGNSSNAPNKGKPFPHGSVEVLIDHNLYYAGEGIIGTAKLTLTQPFPNTSFIIQVKGVEKAQIFVTPPHRGFSVPPKQEFKDQHVIMTNQIVITSPVPDHFPAGTYSYPFSFQLDSQLPPSFIHDVTSAEESSKAKISYKIQAGLFDARSTYYLIKKCPFYITTYRQLVDSQNSISLKVKQSGISSLIFSSYVTLHLNLFDNKISAGDQFQVEIGVDAKDAKHSVQGVVLEFLQAVSVHINGNKVQTNKTLWRKDVQHKVEKGNSLLSPNGIKVIVPSTVTANLLNSCSTKNIDNSYMLKLSLANDSNIVSGFFDKSTDLVMPVQIYRKRSQVPQRIVMPHEQVTQMSQLNQYPMPSQVPNQMYPGYPGQYAIPGQPQFPPQQLPPNPGFGQPGQLPPNPGFVQPQQLPPNPGFIQPQPVDQKPGDDTNEFRVNYPSLDDENFKHL